MKALCLLLALFLSFQTQAACRCNCNTTDLSLCASSYDLDKPCPGRCASHGPGFAPVRAACPPIQVYSEILGRNIWTNGCNE